MLIVSRIIQVPYLASTRYCPGLSIVIKLAFEPVDQRIDVKSFHGTPITCLNGKQ